MATILEKAHTVVRSLDGKRVAITGGTVGIGRAIAALLASEGASVFICGLPDGHLADALTDLRQLGEADGIEIDLSEAGASKRFVDAATAKLGGLDVAVINAAVAAEGLSDMDEAGARYAVSTNFVGYVMSAHAATEAMGGEGDIVFIGSMSAHVLGPSSTVYAGTKAGIAGFSEALRKELGPKGIRVSLIEPGLTGSDMQYPDIPIEKQREMIGKDEMLRAEDIAVGVHYVLSQPRRAVVQQVTIAPRMQAGE
jgi:NAD(P)-dependent dehydrogenase (short-subunit alcohol dehydrogenase family)